MLKLANTYSPRFAPKFGLPTVEVMPGTTFDANNDLTLGADGRTVYHRDGHISRGGTADAIVEYNRRHMTRAAFNEHYGDGDERSESMMLHGANG